MYASSASFVEKAAKQDLLFQKINGPTMSMAWKRREPGAVRTMMRRKNLHLALQDGDTDNAKALLSPENPAQLTRAEFRICALIHGGALPKHVQKQLAISPNTYRSHMRSIYVKTGAKGQLELVHLLHEARGTDALDRKAPMNGTERS